MFYYILQVVRMFDAALTILMGVIILFISYIFSAIHYSQCLPNMTLYTTVTDPSYIASLPVAGEDFCKSLIKLRTSLRDKQNDEVIKIIDQWSSKILPYSSLYKDLQIEKAVVATEIFATLNEYQAYLKKMEIGDDSVLYKDLSRIYAIIKKQSVEHMPKTDSLINDIIEYLNRTTLK